MASSRPSNGLSMTYATAAPATAGGQAGSPVSFLPVSFVRVKMGLDSGVSNFVPYLIDSYLSAMYQRACPIPANASLLTSIACLSELHHKHYAALAPR